jgi:hypothetical protein
MNWKRAKFAPLAVAAGLLFPATALAGFTVTPVPTFPYPSVTVGQTFPASITIVNFATGADANVLIGASNLDFYPACPLAAVSDCAAPEANVFALSATGTSGAGTCPPGTWTIAQLSPGRFRFTPPGPVQLAATASCTVDFTATSLALPPIDASAVSAGVQTNQVASIDGTSPVSGTFRNSGLSVTSVLAAPAQVQAAPGAKLSVSEGCKRVAKANVTGQQISRVTFLVDNKKHSVDNAAPFKATINTVGLAKGRHKLTAAVDFTTSSAKLDTSLKGGFLRCRTKQVQFTG